jgi:DNA-binding transcriptional LysR family regulator
MDRAIDQK